MTIRSSKFYNNPQIGQAFENLAAAFAPPSGADAAGWARANAEREQAARLAELFDYSKSEGYDQARADRMGVLGGLYTPDKSFYAVDRADETTRRGQDVSAASSRYGHDRDYAALTENNVRDNVRAIQTNDADNARALQDRSMQEAGALQRLFAEPVKVGQGERAYLPNQTAAATGLPVQLDGAQKPLSLDETKANVFSALRAQGLLPDADLAAGFKSDTPVENVVGPDGKTPVVVARSDAIGKQPFFNPGASAAPQTENWIGPNGQGGGTAVFDTTARQWTDTATGQPIPAGSRTYTGQLQGGADATGLGPTTSNATEATRLESSLDSAQALVGNIREILGRNQNVAGVPGRIKGVVQSLTSSAQQIAAAFAKDAPEAALSLDEARQLFENELGGQLRGYDADVVRVQSMMYDLAYMRAQINNPGGEVSRQAFERALESMGQGLLTSQTDLETALGAFERDTLGAGRVKVDTLRGRRPASAPAMPSANAPAAPPASSAPAARKRYNPDTGAFE